MNPDQDRNLSEEACFKMTRLTFQPMHEQYLNLNSVNDSL